MMATMMIRISSLNENPSMAGVYFTSGPRGPQAMMEASAQSSRNSPVDSPSMFVDNGTRRVPGSSAWGADSFFSFYDHRHAASNRRQDERGRRDGGRRTSLDVP